MLDNEFNYEHRLEIFIFESYKVPGKMLKVSQPANNVVHDLKCGEIFCISPAIYNVKCYLCASKMCLEQFPRHFQMQHLNLPEGSADLLDLERMRSAKLRVDESLLDNVTIKMENEEYSIKEEFEEFLEVDDKSWRQLLDDAEKGQSKVKMAPNFRLESKLDVEDNWKEKNLEKISLLKDNGAFVEQLQQQDHADDKEREIELKLNKDDELKEKMDNDNVGVDRDWSLEDKISDTDSDPGDKDDFSFPCHICKRSYHSKRSLYKHKYSVHNPNKQPKKPKEPKVEHKCDQCNKMFRCARDLRGHKWKHTGVFCDICGKSFTEAYNMTRHKIRHTGIKAYKCKECEKEFFTDKELKSHMIRHTGRMSAICEICGKQCRGSWVLAAHMRRHTGERPAKCDVCGKSFFSFHDLNVHAVTHSSERPFTCNTCDSAFQTKKALRVHKHTHTEVRKHACKICFKGFVKTTSLNSHMRTHDTVLENKTLQQVFAQNTLNSSNSNVKNQSILSTSATEKVNITKVSIPSEIDMLGNSFNSSFLSHVKSNIIGN